MSPRGAPAIVLMVLSGFAGLGYQIIWTQRSALWLGQEAPALLAVITAFFGGLALGAFALGERIERSGHPVRAYVACEIAIAAWSGILLVLQRPLTDALLLLTGVQPHPAWQGAVAFCGTFLLLLPATAAMGATLPALERVVSQARRTGASIAALYAGNTLGAVVGVLATAMWLLPHWGLARTTLFCVTLNLVCAIAAPVLFTRRAASAGRPPGTKAPGLGRTLVITGLLGIGYEVLVVHVLRQVTENTVYTFALLLAVYLCGTAAGAAAYARARSRIAAGVLRDRLLFALAASCLFGSATLFGAETVKTTWLNLFGDGLAMALASEAAVAAIAFLLPTVVMGALFSCLCQQATASGSGFSRALALNTAGAAAAPIVFGVLLVPLIGPKWALAIVVGGYVALMSSGGRVGRLSIGLAAAAIAGAIVAPPLRFIELPDGGRVLRYLEGPNGSVSVVADADGVRTLRIDNRQQEGNSASLVADARQALLPLLLHPNPRRALFLGLGTGVTARSAAQDARLQVDVVELLPDVITASALFDDVVPAAAPREMRVIAADARRYVRSSATAYDVIVSDNFHPARSGAGSLYTVEHFRSVRARLGPGGVFCQWLPLHQLDLESLRSIVRSFVAASPRSWALLATNSLGTPVLGLITRAGRNRFDLAAVRSRLNDASLAPSPSAYGLEDDLALFGSFVAGSEALARFAGEAPLNSDDRPIVAYRAPRITYAPDSTPDERLVSLLAELDVTPDELLDSGDPAWSARLAAYWAARTEFISVGRGVRPTLDVRQMLAQVREPLLAVLKRSPDFRPAYDPLLRMAIALAPIDDADARHLLQDLAQIQPQRLEAPRALMKQY